MQKLYFSSPTWVSVTGGTLFKCGTPVTDDNGIYGPLLGDYTADDTVVIKTKANVSPRNINEDDSTAAFGEALSRLPYLQKANWCAVDTSNPAFGANYTQHAQMTVEAPFVAVQIGVVNGYATGGNQTVKVAVSSMASAGNPTTTAVLNNGGTWVPAGNGGASLVVPPATVQGESLGVGWGDVVALSSLPRIDNGTFPILCVRVENPSGNNLTGMVCASNAGTPFEVEDYTNAPYGRLYRVRAQSALGVTNPNSMTTTVADQSYGPAIIVRYFLANGTGRTVVVFGDSIWCGYGQPTKNSWTFVREAAHRMSTPDDPVEVCCLANSGFTMQAITRRVSAFAQYCKGTVAILPINSPNSVASGTITKAALDVNAAQYVSAYALLSAQGIPVISCTMFPTSTAVKGWGTSDVLRVDANTARAAGSRRGAVVLDVAALATSGTDVTGQQQLSPSSDGLHPGFGFASIGAPLLTNIL